MTQNNLITIVTMWNKVNELSRENLSQRHEKQPKKPVKRLVIVLKLLKIIIRFQECN